MVENMWSFTAVPRYVFMVWLLPEYRGTAAFVENIWTLQNNRTALNQIACIFLLPLNFQGLESLAFSDSELILK
jgi:hypothetical protein